MIRKLLLTLLLVPALACTSSMHHVGALSWDKDKVEEFEPPQVYQKWFVEVSVCSGTAGFAFDEIDWYLVDSFERDGDRPAVVGYYDRDSADIYLRDDHKYNRRVVKHELLHAMGFRHNHAILWFCETSPHS